MSTTRFAVAGVGSAGRTHARAIAGIDDATVVAGAAQSVEAAREFAADHDCEAFDDVEAMLDAVDPDVLSVCTPSGTHLEPTLSAAERGVDVLCEKPLEITTERIDRMLDAAEESGISLGCIFQRRYKPIVRTLREAVAEGRFGGLAVASAALPWWRDDSYYDGTWQGDPDLAGGGSIMNQTIHSLDAIQWIASAGMDLAPDENPVAEVYAATGVRGRDLDVTDVEDTAVATLRYRDGTLGQLLGTTAMYPQSEMRYELGGRDGTAQVSGDELDTWEFREEREADAEIRERFSGPDAADQDPSPLERPNVEAYLEARETGEPFMLDGAEARKTVAVVEAIYESAETGQPVSLD